VPFRVVIAPSSYTADNLGDTAMLRVALERLRAAWPDAVIHVPAFDPATVTALDARAERLDPYGAVAWSAVRPRVLAPLALMLKRQNPRATAAYLDAIRRADLLLITGGGFMNDIFRRHAHVVLDMLALARRVGAVTALVGQGTGPMTDRGLRRHAATVLPNVDFVALREGVAGRPLIESLGVPPAKIRVTGDDAIALAYRARGGTTGDALGVNLRTAHYAEISADVIEAVGRVVRERAVRLAPIPIAVEEDLRTAAVLTQRPPAGARTMDELLSVLRGCRVVIAGSYHAAVLALSMGIPAVTVARSRYYIDKFRGLASQFGEGCRVLSTGADFERELRASVDELWESAPLLRAALLDRAAAQIAAGEAAYGEIISRVAYAARERSVRTDA
jgi:colanic acid/amylovoran biosynthesis protein